MKKTVRGLTITAIVLMIVGAVMFGLTPKLMAISGADAVYGSRAILTAFPQKAMALFQAPFGLASWVTFGMLGFILILFIVHIIVICVNKRPSGLAVAIFFLLFGLGATCLAILVFTPNYVAEYKGIADEGSVPFVHFLLACYKSEDVKLPIYWLIAIFAEIGVVVLGFIFFVIADITDMVYLGQSPKAIKRDYAKESAKAGDIVVVRDDSANGSGVTPEEIRDIMHAEMSQASAKPAAAESEYQGKAAASAPTSPMVPPTSTAISGPLLVQYINTYSPAGKEVTSDKRSSVPLSEIQENVTGEKSLNADDIRKIIKDELDAQKKESSSQPLIVTVPAPAKEEAKEETKPLTSEDISAIIAEELKGYLGKEEKKEEEEPVVVEPAPEPELSAEDIRSIIREELAAEKKAAEEEAAARKAEEDKKAAEEKAAKEAEERHRREIEEAKEKAASEARAAAIAEANRAAEEEAARKEAEARAEEERKNALTAEQIRQIIAEELGKKEEPKEEAPASLSAEDIRSIIAEELKNIKVNEQKQPSAPVTIIVREPLDRQEAKKETVVEAAPVEEQPKEAVAPVAEEPAPVEEPAPEPAPEPEPVVEEKVEETVEETAPEEEPVEEPVEDEDGEPKKRVVGQINPNLPPHEKIVRIPFQDRMETADGELRSHYNELKSEAMSYGVKSRVSNSGDTFRLHKVTFLKITIAGKGLKLYFALDPKDYANTTLPIQDAGHKGTYKDIPLVFKVKSDLSFRRAKQLIADVMGKNGLTQGEVEQKDWAADIKNADSSEDDKDED